MRPSLLAAVSGLSLLLMAICVPQQASAAGMFDGEWSGKLICVKVSDDTYPTDPPFEDNTPLTIKIKNGKVTKFIWVSDVDLNVRFDGAFENGGEFNSTVTYDSEGQDDTVYVKGRFKDNSLRLKGTWAAIGGELGRTYPCSSNLTRKNNAQLIQAWEQNKGKAAKQTASTGGGSGKLEQHLGVLKRLRANGLINEQEFNSRKKALLDKFLGLKLGSPTQTVAAKHVPNEEAIIKANVAKYRDVNFGKYYALIMGTNDYKHLPKLGTAKTDAVDIAETLRSSYGFEVKLLINATRDDILDAFDEYRTKLKDEDNLLIYYAGHGWLDEETDRGYWLPVDAKANQRRKWLSTATVTDNLKAFNAKHVMVMADSCYSGMLVRGFKVQENVPDYIRKMAEKRARLVITSGGLEPVADSTGGKHSPFASVFLDLLKSNKGVMDGTNMFSKMRRPVMLKADQTPEYADVRKAGHEGGDFLFVRRR